jgi:hypothetical protein
LVFGVAACVEPPPEPPGSRELPEPPAPIAPIAQGAARSDDELPAQASPPPSVPRPRPTGDRERDALELGFWGCRVMGLRLAPTMSGRAVLRATLGAAGEVLEVIAERVNDLPRPVVDCLLDRVAHARFDPRGGNGSILQIPVDFTRARGGPSPVVGTPMGTQSL